MTRRRVLHVCEPLLQPTMTFVQERLVSGRYETIGAAGWTRPDDSPPLSVPCVELSPWSLPPGTSELVRVATAPVRVVRRNVVLWRTLRRLRPDVVHAHFGPTAVRVGAMCRLLGIPVVVSFYGYDVRDARGPRLRRARYLLMFRRVAAVTAEGPFMVATLRALGAPAAATFVLPLTMPEPSPDAGAPLRDGTPLRLVQVARFVEKKGIDTTLDAVAWARAKGTDVRLLLIGSGPLEHEIRAQVARLGLADVVELRGFLAHEELASVWGRVHALIQPSRLAADGDTEGGHPTVILEAQAHAVPVLASTHADIPMVVEHGTSGLLSPEGDAIGLGRHIVELDRDRASLGRMGLAGRAHAIAHHRADAVLEAREQVYDAAITRAARRRVRRRRAAGRAAPPSGPAS